jgi:hypothetical protein
MVAKDRFGSRGKDGGHPSPLPWDHLMADGVDARMQSMQSSRPDPPVDLIPGPAGLQQLNPSHDPMLPAGKL